MEAIFHTLDKGYIQYGIDKINVLIDENDELYFSGKETALALGYRNTKDAIIKHVDKEDAIYLKDINQKNITGHPQTVYITEAGLYNLVFRSRLKSAKKFKYWVTHDVLPAIRKYNKYTLKKQYEDERTSLIEKLQYMEKQYHLAGRIILPNQMKIATIINFTYFCTNKPLLHLCYLNKSLFT